MMASDNLWDRSDRSEKKREAELKLILSSKSQRLETSQRI